jgi:hypothetical protein
MLLSSLLIRDSISCDVFTCLSRRGQILSAACFVLVIACSLTTRSVEQPAIKADIVTVKTRWFIFIILPINGYKSLAALLS